MMMHMCPLPICHRHSNQANYSKRCCRVVKNEVNSYPYRWMELPVRHLMPHRKSSLSTSQGIIPQMRNQMTVMRILQLRSHRWLHLLLPSQQSHDNRRTVEIVEPNDRTPLIQRITTNKLIRKQWDRIILALDHAQSTCKTLTISRFSLILSTSARNCKSFSFRSRTMTTWSGIATRGFRRTSSNWPINNSKCFSFNSNADNRQMQTCWWQKMKSHF